MYPITISEYTEQLKVRMTRVDFLSMLKRAGVFDNEKMELTDVDFQSEGYLGDDYDDVWVSDDVEFTFISRS